MKLQILGTGCPKCEQLANTAQTAVNDLQLDVEIEKISDINDILSFGVMMTPALALDGDVKYVGKVPSVEEIKQLLTA